MVALNNELRQLGGRSWYEVGRSLTTLRVIEIKDGQTVINFPLLEGLPREIASPLLWMMAVEIERAAGEVQAWASQHFGEEFVTEMIKENLAKAGIALLPDAKRVEMEFERLLAEKLVGAGLALPK